MKILHTSDWHIGRILYGGKCYEESGGVLTGLAETIQQNDIDTLLVAGDVFDTSAPSNRAQDLLPFPVSGGRIILSSCCGVRRHPRLCGNNLDWIYHGGCVGWHKSISHTCNFIVDSSNIVRWFLRK